MIELKNVYLVWLEWPEKCFRVDAEALRYLRGLVPKGSRVVRVRGEADFLRKLPTATHVITWHFKKEWYALSPHLRLVATPAAGRELVSTEASEGVTVHFGHFHGPLVSETVLAFVLAWTHGFFQVHASPLWPRSNLAERIDRDLAGTRAVVLGYGRIGRAIGARLEQYGVDVRGLTHAECDALRGMESPCNSSLITHHSSLRAADWLIVALPSDTGTDDLVDAKFLARLPRRCVLVNVGRGNCVDEAALLAALKGGRLAGAYLDVFKNEPTVLAKAAVKPKRGETDLANLPAAKCPWNLIRMPHAVAYSPSYLRQAFQELKNDGCL